jgi:hypothetical protein
LGYFDGSSSVKLNSDSLEPDFPFGAYSPSKGITCVGVVPFIINYNIRFRPQDKREKIIQITKSIRSEYVSDILSSIHLNLLTLSFLMLFVNSFIITQVEALTLPHENGAYEVACNLLNPKIRNPASVKQQVESLAMDLGIEIELDYTTGPTESELVEYYNNNHRI